MWWSDRRSLLLALPLLAAGCGFTPVYGPGGIGGELYGKVLADEPDSEEAYMLVRRLEEQLGRPSTLSTYRLGYEITTVETGQAVTSSGDITRYNLIGRVDYVLRRASDRAVMTSGSIENFSGYSASGSTVDTLTAERDAVRRLMIILADVLVAELFTSVEPDQPQSPPPVPDQDPGQDPGQPPDQQS